MNKIPFTYLEVEYDINGKPFLVQKKFSRGEYLLLACAMKDEGERKCENSKK